MTLRPPMRERLAWRRFVRFTNSFFSLIEETNEAPTPTELNRRMGRKPTHNLDGELSRWRMFWLESVGYRKNPLTGRWEP